MVKKKSSKTFWLRFFAFFKKYYEPIWKFILAGDLRIEFHALQQTNSVFSFSLNSLLLQLTKKNWNIIEK